MRVSSCSASIVVGTGAPGKDFPSVAIKGATLHKLRAGFLEHNVPVFAEGLPGLVRGSPFRVICKRVLRESFVVSLFTC